MYTGKFQKNPIQHFEGQSFLTQDDFRYENYRKINTDFDRFWLYCVFIDGLKLVIVLYTCFHFVPILRKIWHFSIFYFAMVKLNLFCVLFPVSHDGFLQDDCNNQKASKINWMDIKDGYLRVKK